MFTKLIQEIKTKLADKKFRDSLDLVKILGYQIIIDNTGWGVLDKTLVISNGVREVLVKFHNKTKNPNLKQLIKKAVNTIDQWCHEPDQIEIAKNYYPKLFIKK